MPLGGTFGCIIAGILMKNRGRRSLMILSDIIGIIIGFLFIIPNFYIGVISRFIMGLIVGSNSTIGPLYVREISPVSLSAQTVLYFYLKNFFYFYFFFQNKGIMN